MTTSLTRTMAFMVDEGQFLKYRKLRGIGKLSTSYMADRLRQTFALVLAEIDNQRLKDKDEDNTSQVHQIPKLDAPT